MSDSRAVIDIVLDRCEDEWLVTLETASSPARGEGLSAAYLKAALDCVVMADASGRIVEFNPAAERTFGYTREEAIGRTMAELIVPPSLRERHSRAFTRFAETREQRLFGQRLELTGMRADGSEFPVELALSQVEGEPLLICGALRDLTEAKRAEHDLLRLADEHAALRRVATLVAEQASPAEVFSAVADEIQQTLNLPLIVMARYEPNDTIFIIGATGEDHRFRTGTRWPLDPGVSSLVLQTGRPAKVDYREIPGTIAEAAREGGFEIGLGVPIVVDGAIWGVIATVSTTEQPLPDDAEARFAEFTELVATAISNTEAREGLRRLADEQASLRRVATLVAQEASPTEVFAAVAEGVARILGVPAISMIRFESDRAATKIAGWGESPFPVGTRWTLDDPSVMASVMQTGSPARIDDYATVAGAHAERVREAGIRSGIGAPIVVEGMSWGVLIAFSTDPEPISADAESRLARFTDLVASAISNTEARDDLRQLADEQAALRRVATLIAREATPTEVLTTVAKEVAHTLDVPLTALVRYEGDGTATQVGVWGEENPFPVGTSWPLDDHSVSGQVARTGRPARVDDYAKIPGNIASSLAREAGIHTAVGVPVLVDGRPWGVMMALSTAQKPLPAATEDRLAAFTELVATAIANTQARDELRQLAEEQAALRRVATLVARGTDAHAVFDAVCAETGPLIGASSVNLARFTADGFNLTMAGWSLRDTHVPTGTRLPLGPETINGVIQRTVAPARVDSYDDVPGELAALIRERGIRSEVGAPVIVEGRVWGALIAGTDGAEPLPPAAEQRVASFAELIATAVSNATTRSELIASRARIVTASDEARRRIERNLHDGTQQRLVALGLDVQALDASIPTDQRDAHSDLERIGREIEAVLEDVRELSRGLHPALLSQAGLGPSLRALARKSPIPVSLDVDIAERPSESIEIAVYYVISEALANAAKHARAAEISVELASSADEIRARIEDDGIGGAEASAGSGLVGLIDRVEALGGRFALDSPPGHGTTISIQLPLTAEPIAEAARARDRSRSAGDEGLLRPAERSQPSDADTLFAAVAASADALYIVDALGRIKFLNPAALRILAYEDDRQLLGRPSHDTIHYLRCDGTPFPAAECPLLRPRVSGETVRVEQDWFVRQDGSLVPVAYSSAPVPLPDGRGAVVSFRERSEAQPEEETAS
jgi:PAS domain S-box-containing protein